MILFATDFFLHSIGYGLLYIRIKSIMDISIISANIGILAVMYNSETKSKSLFGVKVLCSVVLFSFLFETIRTKLKHILKPKRQYTTRVYPDMS